MEASRNSMLRQSDVIAVITELEEMLRYRLAEGQTVVPDGIGRFSLCVESEGVDDPSKFRIKKHIRRIICRFLPSGHRNATAPSATASLKTLMWIGKKVEGNDR